MRGGRKWIGGESRRVLQNVHGRNVRHKRSHIRGVETTPLLVSPALVGQGREVTPSSIVESHKSSSLCPGRHGPKPGTIPR